MAKRKNPILPTIKDLEAIVKHVQAQVKKSPQDYYDFNGVDDYELLGSAQKELYEKMLQDYVDVMYHDPLVYDELTSDLPDDRDTYSDYALDNFVAECLEESFRQDNRVSDLDLNSHYDELVAIEPDLKDLIYCQLTVGASGNSKEFGYQTGDNSYTGGAYGYPLWAIVSVDIYSHPKSVAKDIRDQIAELWHGENH
jgi:hypothetical protein